MDRLKECLYKEFGLKDETLEFFKQENTIGLFERDTMKGVNELIPNLRRCFFTQASVANTLVEILKRIKWLREDDADKIEIIAQISGYLNTSYIMDYLKQNKSTLSFMMELEKEHNQEEIIELLFDLEPFLDYVYSSAKYFLIDSINEYYLQKEEDLYKYD